MRNKMSFSRFNSMKLSKKLAGTIIATALMLLILLSFLITTIYYNSGIKSMVAAEKRRLEDITANFDIVRENLIRDFVRIVGTEDFFSEYPVIAFSNIGVTTKQYLIQNEISALSNAEFIVHSAFAIAQNGTWYTTYNDTLLPNGTAFIDMDELKSVEGITMLPLRQSPFANSGSVMPVVFPVRIGDSALIEIAEKGDDAELFFILNIDHSALLYRIGADRDEGSGIYITTEKGKLLAGSGTEELEKGLDLDELTALASSHLAEDGKYSLIIGNSRIVSTMRTDYGILVSTVVDVGNMAENIFVTLLTSLLVASLLVICTATMIILATKHYVTNPIERIIGALEDIEKHEYDGRPEGIYDDEFGHLANAIDHMKNTIDSQILSIRREKSEKYRAEIKLLSEQVNPHFLSNTLEGIQREINADDPEVAASMIQALSIYLRTGLAYGKDFVPATEEIRHLMAYVSIMNNRFRQEIQLLYDIDDELSSWQMPKSILQIFAENSIKHGFDIDSSGYPMAKPMLEVRFRKDGDKVTVSFCDNGKGFDEKRVMMAFRCGVTEDESRHLGLNNICTRLDTLYGKDKYGIEVSSVSYFRNEIKLILPLTDSIDE